MATIKPNPAFNAMVDAAALRKAMKGMGTDEKSVIGIMTKRVEKERQEIRKAYHEQFQRDLYEDLKSELGGKFEKLILALTEPVADMLAKELHDAISGLGTDESDLREIICTLTPKEVSDVANSYQRLYQAPLVDVVSSDVSGDFKSLLVALLSVTRETSVDPASAAATAKELYNAGEGRLGTDEEKFIKILSEKSHKQLQLIFNEYEHISGKLFLQAVKDEMSGDLRKGIEAIAKFVTNPAQLFAEQIHKAMKGLGTDDMQLIRVLVWRSEIDLATVQKEYANLYNKSLESDIAGETSGDYESALISLLHGN